MINRTKKSKFYTMDSKELRSLQEATYVAMGGQSRSSSRNVDRSNSLHVASITPQDINTIVENALGNVFYGGQDLHEVQTKETREGTKYKVRVKDRTTNSTYVRFATREKIAELRANPNIASVELTDEAATDKTQAFGSGVNQNRSSSAGYKRPQPVNRPPMEVRMAQRDNRATGGI